MSKTRFTFSDVSLVPQIKTFILWHLFPPQGPNSLSLSSTNFSSPPRMQSSSNRFSGGLSGIHAPSPRLFMTDPWLKYQGLLNEGLQRSVWGIILCCPLINSLLFLQVHPGTMTVRPDITNKRCNKSVFSSFCPTCTGVIVQMLISCTFEKKIYFHALGFQSFAVLVLIMFISS